jgi:hypothetical protein
MGPEGSWNRGLGQRPGPEVGEPAGEIPHSTLAGTEHDPQLFTIWTLTAQFPLGLKWFDSRAVRRKRHLLPAAREPAFTRRSNAA